MEYFFEWLFLIIIFTGLFVYVVLIWNFNFWRKRGIKGPRPKPFYGNLTGFLSNHLIYEYDRIYRQYKGKEPFVGFFVSRQPRLMIIDPKLVREVLISNFKNFHRNEFPFPVDSKKEKLLAQNPFFIHGITEWKEKRAEITPALTANRIKASYPIMTVVCKKLSKFIESELENHTSDGIEAKDLASRYTIEVVSSAVFGIDGGALSKGESRIHKEGIEIIGNPSTFDLIYLYFINAFPLIKKICYFPLISKTKEAFFTNLMHDAIVLREQTKDDRVDFLNYLLHLKAKKNLSDFTMAAHSFSFFIDGFETSSVLIAHVIYMMAKHKEVQKKLREELKGALSEDGSIPFEKLSDLPYLDCVFNETLRLYPPAGYLTKCCTERTEFTNSEGKKVPIDKNVVALVPVFSLHRDQEYYEKAEEFIPERFSEANGGVKKFKDMGVFMPFGDGPRICLGMRFALTQSKAAIAELVLNWELTLNKKTKPEFVIDPKTILTLMDGGVWVDYKKIHESKKTI